MLRQTHQTRSFIYCLAAICLSYLVFELFYNAYAMLAIDEFWFAHIIYHYKNALPYRDFSPYKTVLGYYLLLLPMLSSYGVMATMIFTKNVIAVLNAIILFAASWRLTRFFPRHAVLTSLCMLLLSDIMLSCSTNIRVDLLGYWFCLFSFLFLLENRCWLAGLLLGLGFITTQKAIWYVFASDCALMVCWLTTTRDWKSFTNIVKFNIAIAAVVSVYIAFWSWISDWHTVVNNVFYDATVLYQLDWYDSARKGFWQIMINYNPLLILLWPLTLMSLFITHQHDVHYQRRVFVTVWSLVILVCLVPYKMVFPYYLQVAMPAFLIGYAAFFAWLRDMFSPDCKVTNLAGKNSLWLFAALYTLGFAWVYVKFSLPNAYLLTCLVPLLLAFYITHNQRGDQQGRELIFQLIYVALFFVGGIYSMLLFTAKTIEFNGAYQKANIQVVNSLLQDGSDYVAGIELIYNKTQPIAGMRQLVGPAVDYLYNPTEKLRRAMLASLYEDPTVTSASVVEAMKKSSVKFYVNNYRMMALPDNIKHYLASQYEHFWGSVYLYAPAVSAGRQALTIKFSGNYQIEAKPGSKISLHGKWYTANSTDNIRQGWLYFPFAC